MGYRIDYGSFKPAKSKKKINIPRVIAMTTGFLAAFFLATGLFWESGRQKLQRFLLPGDPDVTGQALETMISQIKDGEPLSDAVTAFCKEVIDGAEMPD